MESEEGEDGSGCEDEVTEIDVDDDGNVDDDNNDNDDDDDDDDDDGGCACRLGGACEEVRGIDETDERAGV